MRSPSAPKAKPSRKTWFEESPLPLKKAGHGFARITKRQACFLIRVDP
jgi:hypothetical protein